MSKRLLITGATGYVGGSLLSKLSSSSYHLRALARYPDQLRARLPSKEIEVVQGDVLNYSSLTRALKGVDIAFYFVHSMGSKDSFEKLDRIGAENFALACRICNVSRIIYLGGLSSDEKASLSSHMASRQEVGKILASQGVQVIELRSSIILGEGSLSYEMMKALVEKLPVMVAPKWISSKVQPIYIEDVLDYLTQSIELKIKGNQIFEIGGANQVSYKEFMLTYAHLKGLKRTIFTVPVLTPGLSSAWLGLVTPIYKRIGRKLIESIMNDSIVTHSEKLSYFTVEPKDLKESLKLCIQKPKTSQPTKRWYDAVSSKGLSRDASMMKFKTRQLFEESITIKAPVEKVYSHLQTLGGEKGWYADFLWKIRGFLDLLVGGVGDRRKRIDPEKLKIGDPLDFWRVVEMEENKKMVLKAEMKLPGIAFLSFDLIPDKQQTIVVLDSIFDPSSFFGIVYWWIFYPFHFFIFKGLLKRIKKEVEAS